MLCVAERGELGQGSGNRAHDAHTDAPGLDESVWMEDRVAFLVRHVAAQEPFVQVGVLACGQCGAVVEVVVAQGHGGVAAGGGDAGERGFPLGRSGGEGGVGAS